ncbi:hypothetical protein [Roseateles oligotrophus]|uniref:hypothetical protein n=1 Tax=Roseateles oligotrophus TaxID=1769250 RepID=UPI00160AB5AE|nr:hypothetical protein [Roseateles oligotrophus]
MKLALLALFAFSASAAGVVAGYTPFLGFFEWHYWSWAVRDLPVVKVAAFNTVAVFVVLFAAFWSCRGDKEIYGNAILGYSFVLPFVVVLAFLPGAESKPDWASLNFGVTIAVFFAVQYAFARSLRERFWERGGRSDA